MQVTPKWSMSHPQPLPCSLKLGHCSLTAQQLLSSYTVPFSVKSQVGLWNTQKARTGSCSCPGAISAGGVPSPKAPPKPWGCLPPPPSLREETQRPHFLGRGTSLQWVLKPERQLQSFRAGSRGSFVAGGCACAACRSPVPEGSSGRLLGGVQLCHPLCKQAGEGIA